MENKTCFACFFYEEFQPVRLKSPESSFGVSIAFLRWRSISEKERKTCWLGQSCLPGMMSLLEKPGKDPAR